MPTSPDFLAEPTRLMRKAESMPCALCDSKEALMCSTCEEAAFCIKDCQAEGERIHKILCRIKEQYVHSNPQPNDSSYLALYFPIDGTGPEFYWSNHRLKVHTNEATGQIAKMDLLSVDGEEVTSGNIDITHNLATKNRLAKPLTFTLRDCRGTDGSKANLSILEMTQGDQRGLWAGPAVLYRWQDHISTADLTYFATFLKTAKDKACSLKHALRVNELEDVEKSRPDLFTAVKEKIAAGKKERKGANAAEENNEVEVEGSMPIPKRVQLRLVHKWKD